jgi:hypothetical protein
MIQAGRVRDELVLIRQKHAAHASHGASTMNGYETAML